MVALTSVNPVGIASGLGPGDITWGAQSEPSQVMASSAGVASILNDYYMLGQTTNLYTFGAQGYASAGLNPVAQFVGSFTSTITPANGGINLTLSNYTSVHSLGDAGGDAGGEMRGHHTYPRSIFCVIFRKLPVPKLFGRSSSRSPIEEYISSGPRFELRDGRDSISIAATIAGQ
jgi:hypothetical protein